MGIRPGDRVVGFMPNMPETIIAMLAATSLGATWSSCSPDFGIKGVLDRFGQIKPRVLFTANGYWFKGKSLDSLERIPQIMKELPSIEKVVVVPYTEKEPDISGLPKAVHYTRFQGIWKPAWKSSSSSFPSITPSTSCTPPGRRDFPSAWSRAPAES